MSRVEKILLIVAAVLLALLAILILATEPAQAQFISQERSPTPYFCLAVYNATGRLEFVVIPCSGEAEASATPQGFPTVTPTATLTPSPSATASPALTATPMPTISPTPTFLTPTPELLDYTPAAQPCNLQADGVTNVRAAPGVTIAGTPVAVLTQLPSGALFGALGYTRDASDGMWVRRLLGGWVARWVVNYYSGCAGSEIIQAGP